MAMSAEHRSKFASLHRQWWRLHMSEKFSTGAINHKQTNKQTNKQTKTLWFPMTRVNFDILTFNSMFSIFTFYWFFNTCHWILFSLNSYQFFILTLVTLYSHYLDWLTLSLRSTNGEIGPVANQDYEVWNCTIFVIWIFRVSPNSVSKPNIHC